MRLLLNLDWEVQTWLQEHRSELLDQVMRLVTELGGRWIMALVVAVGIVVLLVRRQRREAVAVVAAALISLGAVEVIKPVIRRERPAPTRPAVLRPSSFSFPSGHALSSAAICGVLALVVVRHLSRVWTRATVLAGVVLFVFLIGFSRMYLGVHYTTDVIAGWAAGWACALLCACWAGRTDARVNSPSASP